LLYPICLYFLLVPSPWRRASRAYLPRALGPGRTLRRWLAALPQLRVMPAGPGVFLNGQTSHFTFTVHGEQVITGLRASGQGCLLFGAHLGSFEAVRAAGDAVGNLRSAW